MLGKWLIDRPEIWQMALLTESNLDSFGSDRGLMSFSLGQKVREIWHVGLLNSDLVSSPEPLNMVGLVWLEQDESGNHIYADERILQHRNDGWADALIEPPSLPPKLKLLFHPFRYYVLYCLSRFLQLHISPLQMLVSTQRYPGLLERNIDSFQHASANVEFVENVRRWNKMTELAVATEPCFYEEVFGYFRYSSLIGLETYQQKIAQHWIDVAALYQQLGLDVIEKFRSDLCIAAELQDPNKNVHIMLRLTHGDARLKLRGQLGGSMHLLSMAELVRRAAERVFQIELREEDEMGFGLVPQRVKKELYGSARILDAESSIKEQYLRSHGLDYGLRLRWYVEGDTEYYALDSVLGRYSGIELVNLRGQVAARGSKGVAFRDSLRGDLKSRVFSFVSIDGDRSDHLRMVQKAAQDDEICGLFFVSDPDFEFQNFTLAELEELIWGIAMEEGPQSVTRATLHLLLAEVKSGAELFRAIRSLLPEIALMGKGKEWGERLMRYAWNHPEKQNEKTGEAATRTIVDAVELALQAVNRDYHLHRNQMRVNPATGRFVERTENYRAG